MIRAEAVVDLDAIAHNIAVLQGIAPDSELMVVVKADAYGHGAIPVARQARESGINWLGVALPSEALELRTSGDLGRILAWLWAPGDPDIDACVAQGVDLSVSSTWALAEVAASAQAAGTVARIHLKIDTGLSRNGCTLADWPELVTAVRAARDASLVEVEAFWTHFANADVADDPYVLMQFEKFSAATAVAESLGVEAPHLHLANSAGVIGYSAARTSIVRTGISVYGLSAGVVAGAVPVVPAMTLHSRLAMVKTIPAGAGVSYGTSWLAPNDARIGLVPIGYADGIPRAASACGKVLVADRLAPILGRVAMDQFVVDLSDHPTDIAAGAEVTVFGPGVHGEWTADDWAEATETIGYEIVTRLGVRVPRRYRGASWA
jgi:alanine racemase